MLSVTISQDYYISIICVGDQNSERQGRNGSVGVSAGNVSPGDSSGGHGVTTVATTDVSEQQPFIMVGKKGKQATRTSYAEVVKKTRFKSERSRAPLTLKE